MIFTKTQQNFVRALLIFLLVLFGLPTVAQQDQGENKAEPSEPLKITIRPEYQTFEGIFSEGPAKDAPRIETLGPCPREQILSCDITGRFRGGGNKILNLIAGYAYEKHQLDWRGPSLGLLMGGRYARLHDYKILALMGVDPGLEPLWPFPQPDGRMYGSLWFADTLSLADRMAGPIVLIKGGPSQIEQLGGDRKHFSGY